MNPTTKRRAGLFLGVAFVLVMVFSCLQAGAESIPEKSISLTEEELAYIQKNPKISIAIDTSWVPYGFRKNDGSCVGIIPNIMEMAASRVGLQVEYVAQPSYQDAILSCQSGKTTLVSGIADDLAMAEKNNVSITDPYINIGYSAMTRQKIEDLYAEGANYRVALCVGTYAKMAMEKKMPSYEFVEYHSNQECMDAVRQGEADIALVANYSAGYYSSWHEYRQLQTIQINDFSWGLCFGVNKDQDPMLIQILNKSIASISENDVNQAIYAGATEATAANHRLADDFYENPFLAALIAGGIVAAIALMISLVLFQRKKAYELARENTRRELQESVDKERESQYLKLVDEMAETEDRDLIAKGRYNLNQNRNLYYARGTESSLVLPKDCTFEYARTEMIKTGFSQQERSHLEKLLDRNTLMQEYAEGRTEGSYQYHRVGGEEGRPFWSMLKYSLFRRPNEEDIILFVYTYDISERILQNLILTQLSNTEYEALCLIDVATRQYTVRKVMHRENPGEVPEDGDYETTTCNRIDTFVVPEQRDAIKEQFSMENIIHKLSQKSSFEVNYSTVDSEGALHRKRSHFSYLDDSQTVLFYYRTDITEQYNREQQQLLQTENALRQAKFASDSKTEFFSRMSHDMRTPMNGILGMVGLSEDENDPKILKQNMNKIKSSGQYLLGLINDTLDFQKIESGKLKLDSQVIHAQELLDGITEMIQASAEQKGVQFKLTLKDIDTNWYIRTDPLRMKQIFVNLLSNAVKFTPAGGTVEFALELLKRDGDYSYERITVSDTGIGMSRDFLENGIFQPFSQEYNPKTAHYAGTGLGLSIAKKLVELMGGSIQVESELGKGTEFTVNIAFQREDESVYQQNTMKDNQREKNALELLRGKKVLLAEDHPLNAEIARKLLEKAQCTVTWTKNGQECVDELKESKPHTYDVILMDIRMPILDGIKATRIIRSLPSQEGKNIPIIAMTANAYTEDVNNCLNAGMNAHIAKPIDPLVMYETIANALT